MKSKSIRTSLIAIVVLMLCAALLVPLSEAVNWKVLEDVYSRVEYFRKSNKTFHKHLRIVDTKKKYAKARAAELKTVKLEGLGERLDQAYQKEALAIENANVREIRRVRHRFKNFVSLMFGTQRKTYNTKRAVRVLQKDMAVQDATYDRRIVEAEIDRTLEMLGKKKMVDARTRERFLEAGPSMAWEAIVAYDDRWVRGEAYEKLVNTAERRENKAVFAASPLSGKSPLKVSFTAVEMVGEKLVYNWDLGNGEKAATPTASTTYKKSGTYKVRLTVTDEEGEEFATAQEVKVDEAVPVVVRLGTPSAAPPIVPVAGSVSISVPADVQGLEEEQKALLSCTLTVGNGSEVSFEQRVGTGLTDIRFPARKLAANLPEGKKSYTIRASLRLDDSQAAGASGSKLADTAKGSFTYGTGDEPEEPNPFPGIWSGTATGKAIGDGQATNMNTAIKFRIDPKSDTLATLTWMSSDDAPLDLKISGTTAKHQGIEYDLDIAEKHTTLRLFFTEGKLMGTMQVMFYARDEESFGKQLVGRMDLKLQVKKIQGL